MGLNPIVRLSPDLVTRCQCLGAYRVERYALGFNPGSRALSSHGAESDPELQGRSVMAECAVCRYLKINPERLNWTGASDCGFDFEFCGLRFDIKMTKRHSHYLIWPVNKRGIFDIEPFDALILVKQDFPDFEIAGWLTKNEFAALHREADERHVLATGTWYVHESALHPPGLLFDWRMDLPASGDPLWRALAQYKASRPDMITQQKEMSYA